VPWNKKNGSFSIFSELFVAKSRTMIVSNVRSSRDPSPFVPIYEGDLEDRSNSGATEVQERNFHFQKC
jgi:hypothetical protein